MERCGGGMVTATKLQVSLLHVGHHIPSHCYIVQLVPLGTALAGLRNLKVPHERLEQLQNPLPLPSIVLDTLDTARPRPAVLPECHLPPHWKTMRYGLNNNLQHLKER